MKTEKNKVDFFLGAVGPQGFHGFFQDLSVSEGLQLYLLKAGPGCGKSTLMRRLSEASGLPCQHIHCSSDPKSLDGVIFPERKLAVLDATRPHAIEPVCPMVTEQIVSLYDTLDKAVLSQQREAILRTSLKCSQLHAQAACYLKAAAGLLENSRKAAAPAVNYSKALLYARRTVLRYLPVLPGPGQESLRFLSAITPDGPVLFRDTVTALADRILVFHDDTGACSGFLLSELRRLALERGHSILTCPCPMSENRIDHIFVPGLRLAFLTANRCHYFDFDGQKNIHCTRFADTERLKQLRRKHKFSAAAARDLMQQASAVQEEARQCHDSLESLYGRAVDFDRVDQISARLTEELFGRV